MSVSLFENVRDGCSYLYFISITVIKYDVWFLNNERVPFVSRFEHTTTIYQPAIKIFCISKIRGSTLLVVLNMDLFMVLFIYFVSQFMVICSLHIVVQRDSSTTFLSLSGFAFCVL